MEALIDYLEELMDLKQTAAIKFREVTGELIEVKGHIVKMDEVSGRHIIETDAGFVIGADQIVAVNGRGFENIC